MSHIVTINRKKATNKKFAEAYIDSNRKIGAYYTGNGATIGTGLDFAEQKKLLPQIIDVEADDRNFRMAVNQYYADKNVSIPRTGLKLEIGKDKDGDFLNVENFITYKFLESNPLVARNEAELVPNIHLYYIEDSKLKLDAAHAKAKLKKEAYKELNKLSDAKKKLVLRVLSVGAEAAINSATAEEDIDILLDTELEANPRKFLAVCADKSIEEKALIHELISKGFIRKVNHTLLDGDIKLGDNMEEAIQFLNDANNSDVLLTLKAKLKEFAE